MPRNNKPASSNIDLLHMVNFGEVAFAVTAAQAAIKQRPQDGMLWHLLGFANLKLGQYRRAETALLRAGQLLPADVEVKENLALVRDCLANEAAGKYDKAIQAGNFPQALYLAQRTVRLNPLDADAHNYVAVAMMKLGKPDAAINSCRRALALEPQRFEFHKNLAEIFRQARQWDAAIESYRQALQLKLDDIDTYTLLAYAASQLGRLDDAASYCRKALNRRPNDFLAHSSLLHYLTLNERVGPAECFAAHAAFGQSIEAPLLAARLTHGNRPDPDRRLRLGFVSGDLRFHPVACFIEPVWAALDPMQVEIWVYANQPEADDTTRRLRLLSHHWRDVVDLSDEDLSAQIRCDSIDILFDLSGHTQGHRLRMFAMKPAPIQATWIGYPNTTGLQAMDYTICDPFNAPYGLYEHFYIEKFARLPCSGTFSPLADLPESNTLPALGSRAVTFGSFNHIKKLGPKVISAWARVLHAVPNSRLLLGHIEASSVEQRLSADFLQQGIAAERLLFRPSLPLPDYLVLHHEVDILLDCWPYTGGTTTNYALAMGVPVLTMRGPSRVHCQSAGNLGRNGLSDWVAQDVDEFVAIAVKWSNDLPALAHLRAGLREHLGKAPLVQPACVARGLELAVRKMWRRWCVGLPAEHFEISLAELSSSR
jgi:protein O-GlcNAc transferase